MESQEDFRDGRLLTLDMNLMVDKEHYIQYKFLMKPAALHLCLQADTALSQNGLVQTLVEDTKRRMFNTCSKVDNNTRNTMVNDMVNSGHPIDSVRPNIISGLKGVLSKQKKCLKKASHSSKVPRRVVEVGN